MPTFTYSARPAAGGEMQTGEVDLPSKDEVLAQLHRQKLIPVSVREKPKELSFSFGTGITTRDIVIFTRQFATMINSGLPLVQSLDILAEQTENQALRKTISDVLYDVESGHTLADAMGKHPKVFTELFVNMVAAGEAGGILDTILLRLATFLEKNDALVRKIKGAMIYPGVIFSVAGAAIVILLIFVIPTFQSMFESAGIPLPLPTQVVIDGEPGLSWATAQLCKEAPTIPGNWSDHATKQKLSDKNLDRIGFTKYERAGDGHYEKKAGQGPNVISAD